MIIAAPSVNFFISILDNGYCFNYNQGPDQCKLESYNCQKKSILLFDFNLSIFTQNEENYYKICRLL